MFRELIRKNYLWKNVSMLDGVGLFVDDMSTMVRFYRDVLGFEITEGENAINDPFEIALYVDTFEEVDEENAKAVAKGARSVLEPTTEPWGQRTY